MKKITIFIFINFLLSNSWIGINSNVPKSYNKEIISSTEDETIIHFSLEGYSLHPVKTQNGQAFKVSTMLGASLLELGSPDVQKLSVSLKIPNNKRMTTEVISSDFIELENIIIAPSKGNLSRLINPDEVPYSWNDKYNRNDFFPGKLVDLNTPYILRDFRGQAANVYPFQYNPQSKILRIYTNIVISVFSDGPGEINTISNQEINGIDYDFLKLYESHFENFNTNNRFEFIEEQGNMLVISYGDFMDEMEPFVLWKNRKGIPTEMINVSDIGGNSSSIESFVDNYYYTNGLTFLLLVGDANQVPTPSVSGSGSDPSYGFIEGNDSYSEIFVGRFSANSPAELITQVERTIDYEQNPQPSAEWYHSAFSAGSNQGPGWGGLTDDVFLDTIIEPMLLDYTYTNHLGIYDPNSSVQGGIDAINNGVSIINYTGHGWQQGWGNGSQIEVSDVNNLNNMGKLPFVITVGCNVGEFNTVTNSFGESWLRATNNGQAVGGIGHFGSTISQSWEPPMHGQYGMNLLITENFEQGISHTSGGIVTNGCMYMNDMQGSSGINETNYWTLFGDPSLHLRTDEPSLLNTSYMSSIVVGTSSFDITYTGTEVLAAISQNNQLLTSAYGDNGVISLDLTGLNLQPGQYDLVISGYNAFTEQETINIVAPDGAYIVYNDFEITSDSGFNDFVEFGDQISANISIENVGVLNTNGINVTISSQDEYVEIINGNSMIAYAIAGQVASTEYPISFAVAESVPDGHLMEFSVIFNNDQGSWEDSFTVEAHSPVFIASNPQVIDLNSDGIWDSGETANIIVNCANEGSADFNWYPGATISTTSEYVSILSDPNVNTWYGIFANTSYEAQFLVEADANTPDGTIATFVVDWGYSTTAPCENDCVQNDQLIFSVTIGLPVNNDVAFPENILATESDNGIFVQWDEPNQYDCIAEAPYNDECYEYVITIDPYCCDNFWDGLCDMQYDDCNLNPGDGGSDNECVCNEIWNPVCGINGNTYSNECYADCEDIEIAYWGECENQTSCSEGYVEDCSGDGDCCSEMWIGDGVGDCEDQYYGCDLSCYENDGGDCSSQNTASNQNLSNDQRYRRAENLPVINSLSNFNHNREEIIGYNVYRDGMHIAFTEETSYLDLNYSSGSTYCYSVSVLYENYQSLQSLEECITTEGTTFETGDVNTDNEINILDIVMLVNMIIGIETPNYELGDLNSDDEINVLDIILVINNILDASRLVDATNANILKSKNELHLVSNGFISGVELKIAHERDAHITLTDNSLLSKSSTIDNTTHIIIIAPNEEKIFEIDGDYEIQKLIVANSSGRIATNTINEFKLGKAYPNPFNPKTTFSISLSENQYINISVYNALGQLVQILHNSKLEVGDHKFTWNAHNQPSGIYFIKAQTYNYSMNQKIVLLK